MDMLESTNIRHGEKGSQVAAVVVDIMSIVDGYVSALSALASKDPSNEHLYRREYQHAIKGLTGVTCGLVNAVWPEMDEDELNDFLRTCTAIHRKVDQ